MNLRLCIILLLFLFSLYIVSNGENVRFSVRWRITQIGSDMTHLKGSLQHCVKSEIDVLSKETLKVF